MGQRIFSFIVTSIPNNNIHTLYCQEESFVRINDHGAFREPRPWVLRGRFPRNSKTRTFLIGEYQNTLNQELAPEIENGEFCNWGINGLYALFGIYGDFGERCELFYAGARAFEESGLTGFQLGCNV